MPCAAPHWMPLATAADTPIMPQTWAEVMLPAVAVVCSAGQWHLSHDVAIAASSTSCFGQQTPEDCIVPIEAHATVCCSQHGANAHKLGRMLMLRLGSCFAAAAAIQLPAASAGIPTRCRLCCGCRPRCGSTAGRRPGPGGSRRRFVTRCSRSGPLPCTVAWCIARHSAARTRLCSRVGCRHLEARQQRDVVAGQLHAGEAAGGGRRVRRQQHRRRPQPPAARLQACQAHGRSTGGAAGNHAPARELADLHSGMRPLTLMLQGRCARPTNSGLPAGCTICSRR